MEEKCWLTSSFARDARGLMLGKEEVDCRDFFFLAVLKQDGGAKGGPSSLAVFAGRRSAELAFGRESRDDPTPTHCITKPRLNRVALL